MNENDFVTQDKPEPWEENSYRTGRTQPPKSRSSLIAVLLAVIIFLGLDEFVINSPTFDELDEDAICVPECNSNPEGSCKDSSGYFAIDNLFSELLTDYQKLLARRNLGIGDENLLKWGSIKGNLVNQTDLLTFVKE